MGWLSKAKKKIKKAILKPINKAIKGVKKTMQIDKLMAMIITIMCFAEYLQRIFKWVFNTINVITRYAIATPLCSILWVLNSIVMFVQYILFDVLIELVLIPSRTIGKTVGYPLEYKFDKKTKKALYEYTNILKRSIKLVDENRLLPFKIYNKCFNIGTIKQFPVF